ncbi:MAG TPA: Ig-like domain-containing protein, partial [Gemmatimonadales bacterium]
MSPLLQRIGRIVVILGGVGALARCGGDGLTLPPDTRPAEITKVKGDGQTGAAGAALPESLVVAVLDARGEPAVNRRVQFALEEDITGAGVSPELVRTDEQGEARAEWVLGAVAGPQAVVATVQEVDGLTARFVAEVGAGAAQQLAMVSGDGQEAAIGTPVIDSLVVVATDQFGNPVPDVTIEWDAAAGSVEPGSSTTGADGRAATSWILGSSTGQQTATASSTGLTGSPVTFTATAVPGSATRLI